MWFQLGNEPDLYHERLWPNHSVPAADLVGEFRQVRAALDTYLPGSKLFGPDVAVASGPYFESWLEAQGADEVDGITWHFYYGNGKTAHVGQWCVGREISSKKPFTGQAMHLNLTSFHI
jgi:hypothetical protein